MVKNYQLTVIAIVSSALLWWALIPIWHTPDEQAHFAQVSYVAEKGKNPGTGPDTNLEIYESEKILGTLRDDAGRNKFTFHPEYRIDYSGTTVGKHEKYLSSLAKTDAKKTFIITEASKYPEGYYRIAGVVYSLFSQQDIFFRIYSVRLVSVSLFLVNVLLTYLIGAYIFEKDRSMKWSLPLLVGFHPMMIFSNIGVSSDAMGNVIFTTFLYTVVRLIYRGLNIPNVLLLVLSGWFAVNTKLQFIIVLPAIFLIIIFMILRDIKTKGKWLAICALVIFALAMIQIEFKKLGAFTFAVESLSSFNLGSFFKFTKEYTISHTYREVLPWYWGVYDWLGVVYPRIVYRLINGMLFVSIIGFGIWLVKTFKKNGLRTRQIQTMVILLTICALYFGAISMYDWLSWSRSSFQLGVQGRYFFPQIVVHMLVIIFGWKTIADKLVQRFKFQYPPEIIIIFCMVMLNSFAMLYVSSIYYNVSNVANFVNQAGQYKPWFIKVYLIPILTFFYVVSTFFLIFSYRKFSIRKGPHA